MAEPADNRAMSAREREDELLREALATGLTYAEAGALAGVSARTVRRRMKDPQFAAGVAIRRGEHVGVLTGQLVQAGTDAIEVLQDCLADESPAIRLKAAQLVLGLGTQLRRAHDMDQRFEALESRFGVEDHRASS